MSHPAPEVSVLAEPRDGGWSCRVTVSEGGRSTVHEVAVSRAELGRLAPDAPGPEGIVEAAFRFLLAREPKESILRRFQLSDIGRYFPGWEQEVGERLRDAPERRIGQ